MWNFSLVYESHTSKVSNRILLFNSPCKIAKLKRLVTQSKLRSLSNFESFEVLSSASLLLSFSDFEYFCGILAFCVLFLEFNWHNSRPELATEHFSASEYFYTFHGMLKIPFTGALIASVLERCYPNTWTWPVVRGVFTAQFGLWFLAVNIMTKIPYTSSQGFTWYVKNMV